MAGNEADGFVAASVFEQRVQAIERENAELRRELQAKSLLIEQLVGDVARLKDLWLAAGRASTTSSSSSSSSSSTPKTTTTTTLLDIEEAVDDSAVHGLVAALLHSQQPGEQQHCWQWEAEVEGYLIKDAPWLPRLIGVTAGSLNVYKPHWTVWECPLCRSKNRLAARQCPQPHCEQTRPEEVYRSEPLDRYYLGVCTISASADGQTFAVCAQKIPTLDAAELRFRFAAAADAQAFRRALLAAKLAANRLSKDDVFNASVCLPKLKRTSSSSSSSLAKERRKQTPSPSKQAASPARETPAAARPAARLSVKTFIPSPEQRQSPFAVGARPDLDNNEGL